MHTASPVSHDDTRSRSWTTFFLAAMLSACVIAPAPAHGQQPGDAAGASWPAVSAGARFGYDQSANGEVVGVQVRIPVLRSGILEVVPNGDVTFLSGLREYGLNVDAVYVRGGRGGGVYAGGGLSLRNSIFGTDPGAERSNELGYGAVFGLKTGITGRIGTQIEFRWIFFTDLDYDPRAVTLGVNVPLWGWNAGR